MEGPNSTAKDSASKTLLMLLLNCLRSPRSFATQMELASDKATLGSAFEIPDTMVE